LKPRRRSKRVNSKTVRWTVFEEGKPCKRGFPFEKHGRSFPQAACGLTDACGSTDNLESGSCFSLVGDYGFASQKGVGFADGF
ncbi:MAG: hypothetical protein IJM87_09400, partial [Ruminococcus sp.]|nr:hypothetical protein [Ruminococcus sp.]